MKPVVALILALILLLSFIPFSASADTQPNQTKDPCNKGFQDIKNRTSGLDAATTWPRRKCSTS